MVNTNIEIVAIEQGSSRGNKILSYTSARNVGRGKKMQQVDGLR